MTYQYKREPLSVYEAYRLLNAAKTLQEKLCVWGLLEGRKGDILNLGLTLCFRPTRNTRG